jgi:hypothetical protein
MLLLPQTRGTGGGRGEGGAGSTIAGIWDARAGEENCVRASAAVLCRHQHTGDERALPGQRGGDGCPSHWRARSGHTIGECDGALVDLRQCECDWDRI